MKIQTQDLGIPAGKSLLLFDGVCNLCNGFVQFTIPRDPNNNFVFASLQSEVGQQVLERMGYKQEELSTVILIEEGQVYTHSSVALRMVRKFRGAWPLLGSLGIIPKPIRDAIYNWVAANRYRWFGKKDACWIPTPDLRERFIG
ncbi:MAG: thiol-disulfide oxidoreductase DCC family protein [Bacteroidota bacterium]